MFSIYSYDLNAKKGSKVKDLFSSRSDFDYSISPSGEWLAMKKSYENKIILVNPSTGKRKQLFEVSHQLKEYTFSSDGHSIFTVTTDNNIYQWDIKSGEFNFLYKYDEQIYHLHNSPDGSLLVSLTNGGSILIIELDTLSHRIIKPTQKPIDIEFSIDGKNIITLTNKNELQKFNVDKLFIDSLEIKEQIYKSELKLNVKLQGVELVKTTESLNLYNKPPNKPSWPKHHPFHWQEKSEQGDPEALLQLGIIAQRDKEWDKAQDFYQKAKVAGHKNADYRLKINELMHKEYSKEPVH
jgi:WD40 repeat protein